MCATWMCEIKQLACLHPGRKGKSVCEPFTFILLTGSVKIKQVQKFNDLANAVAVADGVKGCDGKKLKTCKGNEFNTFKKELNLT